MASKGYEQVSIQDIIDELQIAKGTVYHYFDSKVALLMALVERIGEKAKQLVLPIVSDRELSAQDKLVRFFDVLDRYKRANKDLIFSFMRVWYTDENALFRNRLYSTRIKWLAPLLTQIIQEGVEEGVFNTPYPDQAARMIIALLEDLGYAIAEILLVEENERFDFSQMVRLGEATADAMERLLGMKSGHLLHAWREDFLRWRELLE
jgi:AcrR family transcriptional regulator